MVRRVVSHSALTTSSLPTRSNCLFKRKMRGQSLNRGVVLHQIGPDDVERETHCGRLTPADTAETRMTNVLVAPGEAPTHSGMSAPVELDSIRQDDTRWRPIGEVLVAAGAITREELQEALQEQRLSGKRLGEVLIEAGRISWLSLAQAIADQTSEDAPDEQLVDASAFAPPMTAPTFPSVAEAVGAEDPESKLRAVESLLRERQRAFIELVTTTETLRRRVSDLEDTLNECNVELAQLKRAAREAA